MWRFKTAVGWIRPDVPLLAVAEDALNSFVAKALKRCKRKDMKAADRITIAAAGWSAHQVNVWKHIKKGSL